MADLSKSRSAFKGKLTRAYGDMDLIITMGDLDEQIQYKSTLRETYNKFATAHNKYHQTLSEDEDITASDTYLDDVRKNFVKQLKLINAAIEKNTTSVNPKASSSTSATETSIAKTMAAVANIPPLTVDKFGGT